MRCCVPALDCDLSDTTEMLRREIEDFASREIAPNAAKIDADNAFPLNLVCVVVMGLFSYYLVERPFLKLKDYFHKPKRKVGQNQLPAAA